MLKMLFRFWLRRLAFTFCAAAILLFVVNYSRYGISQTMLMDTWLWAVLTALLAATLSTYWAYTRQCKVLKNKNANE